MAGQHLHHNTITLHQCVVDVAGGRLDRHELVTDLHGVYGVIVFEVEREDIADNIVCTTRRCEVEHAVDDMVPIPIGHLVERR